MEVPCPLQCARCNNVNEPIMVTSKRLGLLCYGINQSQKLSQLATLMQTQLYHKYEGG